MSVEYDVIFRSGEKLQMAGQCFGALNEGRFSHWSLRAGADGEGTRGLMRRANNHQEQHAMLRFYPVIDNIWENRYWEQMATLLNTLPWLKEYVVLRPSLKSVDIISGGYAGDQVIFAAMMFRNLASMPNYARSYLRALELGLTPQQALIASATMVLYKDFMGRLTAGCAALGEYNTVNINTFGRQALRNMMTQGVNYNPWRQDDWQDQNGYRRDEDVDGGIRGLNGREQGRCLLDALSVDNDEQLYDDRYDRDGWLVGGWDNQTPEWFDDRCRQLQAIWPE